MFRFDGFMSVFFILFFLVFGVILVLFIVTAVRGISQWNKNNRSPRLTVPATVVSKRTDVSTRTHHHGAGAGTGAGMHAHTSRSTWYYATFEFESGDRMEFALLGEEYGLLCEGDRGRLTFQGTRFLAFERE